MKPGKFRQIIREERLFFIIHTLFGLMATFVGGALGYTIWIDGTYGFYDIIGKILFTLFALWMVIMGIISIFTPLTLGHKFWNLKEE